MYSALFFIIASRVISPAHNIFNRFKLKIFALIFRYEYIQGNVCFMVVIATTSTTNDNIIMIMMEVVIYHNKNNGVDRYTWKYALYHNNYYYLYY